MTADDLVTCRKIQGISSHGIDLVLLEYRLQKDQKWTFLATYGTSDNCTESVFRCIFRYNAVAFTSVTIDLSHKSHSALDKYLPMHHFVTEMCTHFISHNRPISQIPQCIRQISYNAPFCDRNVHPYAHFCHKMVYCGIWNWCIAGFVQQVYWCQRWHTQFAMSYNDNILCRMSINHG